RHLRRRGRCRPPPSRRGRCVWTAVRYFPCLPCCCRARALLPEVIREDPLKETSRRSPISGKFLPVKGEHCNQRGAAIGAVGGGAPMTACCRPRHGGEGGSAIAAGSEGRHRATPDFPGSVPMGRTARAAGSRAGRNAPNPVRAGRVRSAGRV